MKDTSIIGISFKDKCKFAAELIESVIALFIWSGTTGEISALASGLNQTANEILQGIAPSPETVRAVVNKMPFQPFGVPGMTNTAAVPSGELAQQYKAKGYDWTDLATEPSASGCICRGMVMQIDCPVHAEIALKFLTEEERYKYEHSTGIWRNSGSKEA